MKKLLVVLLAIMLVSLTAGTALACDPVNTAQKEVPPISTL